MTLGSRTRLVVWLALLALGSAPVATGLEDTAASSGRSRWGANYFPNIPLVTHEGKSVRFFDDLIDGKVVAINFIYTSCSESCPLETARMARVQQILGDRVGRDVFMYSISIDPEHDTPEVLKAYAEKFKIGPGWTFLTGSESDITLLRKRLGLYIEEIQNDSNDHNLTLVIGNQATGRWMKSSPFENPYVLASQIGSWLHNFKLPPREGMDYASAPKLRNISKGESLFRTRCAACHTIGDGDVATDERRVGPDLMDVTERRERGWLSRWLANPDKLLAEKDPIATALFEAYNRVAMPNARLNPYEIETLIGYLESESRRRSKTHQHAAHMHH